jgi:hypothetical protein
VRLSGSPGLLDVKCASIRRDLDPATQDVRRGIVKDE